MEKNQSSRLFAQHHRRQRNSPITPQEAMNEATAFRWRALVVARMTSSQKILEKQLKRSTRLPNCRTAELPNCWQCCPAGERL
jgi:hypothetical protein